MKENNFPTSKSYYLTIQEAAEILNVSLSYIKKLLEEGKISFNKVEHRLILASDLKKFKDDALQESKESLQNLVDQAQFLDIGY
ncbi:DNA binding domain, excisionase family [Legionella beliardensis]|uniref:DNA binding domain, excisionase family n=1 Tax=Legionella beliardensis TaxID=91822 RepID=A0A378I161_9GAMM|nr:excisionase family DNA-binding protein [Legionella beliardensis]STX28471.1 DNA binding domain, excisionase family [Legionella beliardensis]